VIVDVVREVSKKVDALEIPFNRHGLDPYGVSKRDLKRLYAILAFFYRHYFRVSVYGIDHVPRRGRAMIVGNHSGGWALDGMMVLMSMLLEMDPPRLAQGMAEKFLNRLPLFSQFTSRTGNFTGTPENAVHLLEHERLLMVFPEGARGTAKLYKERHSLVKFGTGFMRLALQTGTPIIPFAFVGGGEAIPTVMNLEKIGSLVGVPYIPVTPYGVALPRPVPLAIHYGVPMEFHGNGNEEDAVIEGYVDEVKARIASLLEDGVRLYEGRDAPRGGA